MDNEELKQPTRPAWVIWLGIVVLVLVLVMAITHVLLGGGPGMHG